METVKSYIKPIGDIMDKSYGNPYIVGIVGLIAIVYGSLMAPRLPPRVASWFSNPIFKIIFIFLILVVRNVNPVVSIILAIGFIVSMQTLNRYRVFSMANDVATMTQSATQDPNVQIRQEIENDIKSGDVDCKLSPRIEDPNDMSHPGWDIRNAQELLYDLNPPFVNKNLPSEINNNKTTVPSNSSQFEGKLKTNKIPSKK
jgi:ABC-type multidrug transport system fused ATPase/permease subunit